MGRPNNQLEKIIAEAIQRSGLGEQIDAPQSDPAAAILATRDRPPHIHTVATQRRPDATTVLFGIIDEVGYSMWEIVVSRCPTPGLIIRSMRNSSRRSGCWLSRREEDTPGILVDIARTIGEAA